MGYLPFAYSDLIPNAKTHNDEAADAKTHDKAADARTSDEAANSISNDDTIYKIPYKIPHSRTHDEAAHKIPYKIPHYAAGIVPGEFADKQPISRNGRI